MNKLIITPDDAQKIADDIALATECEKILLKHYPGYQWAVKLEEDTGMLYIINLTIQCELMSNTNYGFRLTLNRVYDDPDRRCIMRAGGEILERAMLARGWYKGDEIKHVDGVNIKHQPIQVI